MRNSFIISIIIILMISNACQNKEKAISTYHVDSNEITKIDINTPIDSSKINLTALGEDLRVVRLETSDSCLFGNASYLIGKEYIIAFSQQHIILLDQNGKYIRTLSSYGKGPQEFRFIIANVFNKQENQLIAMDYGRSYIHCWSLPNGQYSSIPLAQKGGAYTLIPLTDTTLKIANYRTDQTKYKLYSQTLSGRFLDGLLNTGKEDSRRVNWQNNLYKTGTALYYRPHHSDSIFQVLSDTLMLKYVFPINQNQRLHILQFTERQMIFAVYNITKEKKVVSGKNWGVNYEGYNVFYIVDLTKGQITCSRQINNDYFGVNVENRNITFQENGLFHLQIPASKLTTLIPEILEKNDIDATVRQRLEQLKSEITEEDNPILIIGTSKPFTIE